MTKPNFDYAAEVAAADVGKVKKKTLAQVVRDHRVDFEGFARADAKLDLAIARIAELAGCSEGGLRREFARQHRGWQAFRRSLPTIRKPAIWTADMFDHGGAQHG